MTCWRALSAGQHDARSQRQRLSDLAATRSTQQGGSICFAQLDGNGMRSGHDALLNCGIGRLETHHKRSGELLVHTTSYLWVLRLMKSSTLFYYYKLVFDFGVPELF